jgi:hypothetical protein
MQRITNPLQGANHHRRVSLKRVSLKRRKKAKPASRRAATKANDKIKREKVQSFSLLLYRVPYKQLTKILIIAYNFSRKALRFMKQAAICMKCPAGFRGLTDRRRQPGSHDNIYGNSISQRIPKPHTGRLVFHLLPVP